MKRKYAIVVLCAFVLIISASSYISYGGDDRGKGKCFDFVYPISFTMPDGITITVENKDDWGGIKAWYDANPDVKERPQLQYPVNIIFKDGTIKTINNEEELKSAYEECGDKDRDDDDDKDGILNKLRDRLRDRLRTLLERLPRHLFPRLRERLFRE